MRRRRSKELLNEAMDTVVMMEHQWVKKLEVKRKLQDDLASDFKLEARPAIQPWH